MKKLKHIKLFENLDESVYSEIQKMIDENQFLKGKVTADKNTVFEAGDFILLLGELGHITDAHVDEKIPGSKFEKGVDLKKAIVSLVSNNKPNELFKGNEKVTDSKQADKFKWLGLDTKVPVGIENVHKLDVNSDEFKDLKVYTYKDSRGNEFKIKVKEGEGNKTTFLSFIGGKIGEIGGKPVLSVITAFPGKNGSTIANRNDFMKSGYYFTTQSKEVLSSEVKESKRFKHLKRFESFGHYYEMNELVSFVEAEGYKKKAQQISSLIKEYDRITGEAYRITGGGNSGAADEWDSNFYSLGGFDLKKAIDEILEEWKRTDSKLQYLKDYLDKEDLERLKREKIIQ